MHFNDINIHRCRLYQTIHWSSWDSISGLFTDYSELWIILNYVLACLWIILNYAFLHQRCVKPGSCKCTECKYSKDWLWHRIACLFVVTWRCCRAPPPLWQGSEWFLSSTITMAGPGEASSLPCHHSHACWQLRESTTSIARPGGSATAARLRATPGIHHHSRAHQWLSGVLAAAATITAAASARPFSSCSTVTVLSTYAQTTLYLIWGNLNPQ